MLLGSVDVPTVSAFVHTFIQQHYNPKAFIATAGPDQGAQFVKAVGPGNENGIFVPNGWYGGFKKADSEKMVQEYIAKYGGTPSEVNADVAEAYSVGQVLAQAVKATGGFNQQKILSYLHSGVTLNSVQGPVKFDSLGENLAQTTLTFQWQNGKLVQTIPTAAPQSTPPTIPEARLEGLVTAAARRVQRPQRRRATLRTQCPSTALIEAIIDGILTGGVYALMAAGLTLIFGVMDIINIAQGVMVVLGAYLSYALSTHLGIGLLPGLLITVPAMFVLGVAIEFCFMRRLRDQDRTAMSVLVTYAVAIVIEGVLTAIFGVDYQQLQRVVRQQLGPHPRLLPALHLPDRIRARGRGAGGALLHALPDQVRPRGAGVTAEPHGRRPDRDRRQPRARDLSRDRRRRDRDRRDGVRRDQLV